MSDAGINSLAESVEPVLKALAYIGTFLSGVAAVVGVILKIRAQSMSRPAAGSATGKPAWVDRIASPIAMAATRRREGIGEWLTRPQALLPVLEHDLFGTKDVQNAITASYVWMADQIGHVTLGLIPTLLLCWLWTAVWPWLCAVLGHDCAGAGCGRPDDWLYVLGFVAAPILVMFYWLTKELQDYRDSRSAYGGVFPFDAADLRWNVKTALAYFGVGATLAAVAFAGFGLVVIGFFVWIGPAGAIAYWWLRRKMAFQQAGLPYLYRLANYTAKLASNDIAVVGKFIDPSSADPAAPRHLLLRGSLGSGRTSLAVGMGTEFAFSMGICRYISLTDLVELTPGSNLAPVFDDGRVLWPFGVVEMLIVDDVDAKSPSTGISLTDPQDVRNALGGANSLNWLRDRRSVWVIGPTQRLDDWVSCFADLIGIPRDEIHVVDIP